MRKQPSSDHPTAVHRPSDDRPSTARREKIQRKTKCVSNDRSRHDDQFCPKIVKIGAILNYFWPLQSLRLPMQFIRREKNTQRKFTQRIFLISARKFPFKVIYGKKNPRGNPRNNLKFLCVCMFFFLLILVASLKKCFARREITKKIMKTSSDDVSDAE